MKMGYHTHSSSISNPRILNSTFVRGASPRTLGTPPACAGTQCFLFRLKVFVVDYPVVLDVGGPCSYDICSEAVFCAIDHFDQPFSAILRTLAPFAASTGGRLSPNFLSVTMWLP